MPIFKEHKCIHVHIPKTAGTTINAALGIIDLFGTDKPIVNEYNTDIMYGFTEKLEFDHMTASQLMQFIPEKVWFPFFKFAFVRNPYDRLLSQYCYASKHMDYRMMSEEYFESFPTFIQSLARYYDEYEKDCSQMQMSHYIPQWKFVTDSDGKLLVDYIGKFESFNAHFKFVLDTCKITPHFDPFTTKLQASEHRVWTDHYDNDTKRTVYNLYKGDFKMFDYEM
jgi:hypothetical protein